MLMGVVATTAISPAARIFRIEFTSHPSCIVVLNGRPTIDCGYRSRYKQAFKSVLRQIKRPLHRRSICSG